MSFQLCEKRFSCFILSTFLFLSGLSAQSGEKFSGWKKAETEHFTFIYEDSSRETTEAYALIADDAWNKIANIYSIPKDHFNIYVTDRTNTVNAFTYFSPTEIGMFTTPPTINDFGFRVPWKQLFFTHELIHAANVTFEDKNQTAELLFGPFVKSIDFSRVPGWALEGLTTVLETELTEGGRGRSPYFELQYKAPTLENSLISYNQIGLENEPPRGQSYVMGYLIMRSIADRFGIQALADIERNRKFLGSWEDSVKLVTGYTAEEIYRDVKIGLVKKYAKEREIPEGITISPRSVNTNFYEPAYVYSDGSLIVLRTTRGSSAAVVKLNPALKSGSAYIEEINPDKDLNTVFNETILFEGMFNESHSITSDENGTVYASMGEIVQHRAPGMAVDFSIYKWTEKTGLERITKSGSYVQPSVSKDGKTLVALRQYGLNYALVKIDVESGKETILLKESGIDFIQPSLNSDGSKVTFLVLDGSRAKIGVCSLEEPENYMIIYNEEGPITDPSYPHWGNENIVFTDNQRGRLEAFEYLENEKTIKPVVADPCGVLWASKTGKGIIYSSFSATGFVLKIKPENEWGNVPDFEGPSLPGEIIHFGMFENDYPDFSPYEKLCEVEVPEKSFKELVAEGKNQNKDEPVPINGKVVKHRKEENIKRAEEFPDPETELSEEKKYFPLPSPFLYFPYVTSISDANKDYLGIGAGLLCLTPKLQMTYGTALANFTFYTGLNNFDGNIFYYAPAGTGTISFDIERVLQNLKDNNSKSVGFKEINMVQVGYKYPIYDASDGRKSVLLKVFADTSFKAVTQDSIAFAAFSKNDYLFNINGIFGIEFEQAKKKVRSINNFETGLYGLGVYDLNSKKFFPGVESEILFVHENLKSKISYDADLTLRYTDYPTKISINDSLVKFHGNVVDCEYPGRAVLRLGTSFNNLFNTFLNLRIYGEGLCSFGQNTYTNSTPVNKTLLNINFNKELAFGLELFMDLSGVKMGCGYNVLGNPFDSEAFASGEFYFTLKYDWFRY